MQPDFENVEMVDEVPSENGQHEPETALAKGTTGPPANRPSMDAALIQESGASFSPIMVMVRASEEPLDYLVRHRLDNRDIHLMILGNSLIHGAVTGRVNPGLDNYLRLTMSQGEGGAALRDAKEMYMGRQDRARDDRRDGILMRAQTLNQEQIEQNVRR